MSRTEAKKRVSMEHELATAGVECRGMPMYRRDAFCL